MPTVAIVDTCILLNVLDVPGFNQNRDDILNDLQIYISDTSISLLLPVAAIIETGNHISHVTDGRLRREYAEKFVEQVRRALNGDAPWTPTQNVDIEKLNQIIDHFPDSAMRGIGLGDLTIHHEWELACKRHPNHRVFIWSIDAHLAAYDRT